MATLNQCSFIGRLGKDPDDLKVTGEGKPYIQFSLAVDQGKNDTMWLNVTAWEKLPRSLKSPPVKEHWSLSRANFRLKKYKDKTTQAERLSVEISASNVQILEKKPKEGDRTTRRRIT